jgi:hypothetical protein
VPEHGAAAVVDDAERVKTAQLLLRVAADADRTGFPFGGVIRRGAALLLEVPDERPGDSPGSGAKSFAPACQGCGVELARAAKGRPRRWCSETCRRRHRP